MKNALKYVLAVVLLASMVMVFNGVGVAGTPYEITLNHENPVEGKGITYESVVETAYVVTPHIIMTLEVGDSHFPDDGVVKGTDAEAWFYLVDWNSKVKVYLIEVEMVVTDDLPEWVGEIYSVVVEELEKDGGWEVKINSLKKEEDVGTSPNPRKDMLAGE